MTGPDPTDLPDGQYVTWRGQVYPGSVTAPGTVLLTSDSPQEGFEPSRTGRSFRRTVPRAEAEVWTLRTRCRWRDLPCAVLGQTDGRTSLRYLGEDAEQARAAGMTEVDRGVFSVTVPTSEVSDLAQVRTPA